MVIADRDVHVHHAGRIVERIVYRGNDGFLVNICITEAKPLIPIHRHQEGVIHDIDADSPTSGGGQDVIILDRGFYCKVSVDHASSFCPDADELFIGVRLKNWFVKEATRQTARTSRDS